MAKGVDRANRIIGTGLDGVPWRLYDRQATNRRGLRMRIIAHTKYGVFETVETEFNEAEYAKLEQFLEQINKVDYFSFWTEKGTVYLNEGMIRDTLFVLQK
jgi:hypothetical protein